MLSAHGVPLRQHLPGLEDAELGGSFLLEESAATLPMNSMPLTEHSTAELGTIRRHTSHCGKRVLRSQASTGALWRCLVLFMIWMMR